MSKLVWDQVGERLYETGTKKGVLYPFESNAYAKGVAWNGLTAVTESPSGAEATAIYADDIKYLNLRSAEEFGATIEAYTYPDEFAECDGSAYIAPGIKIGPASPSEKSYQTINDSPEAITFSWEVATTPVEVKGFKPTATLEIDSTKVDADKLTALEDILYGTENAEPRLPLPDEVVALVGKGTTQEQPQEQPQG